MHPANVRAIGGNRPHINDWMIGMSLRGSRDGNGVTSGFSQIVTPLGKRLSRVQPVKWSTGS